jgi:hypothetical protein
MNTLRENDGYPPQYPTAQDSEAPVLVTNQGRLMVTQKPAGFGTFNLMCSDTYVKLPYNEACEVRITNNTQYEIAVSETWSKSVLGDFDKEPFKDGESVNGVDGWEADYAVTTPDDRNDELRQPILGILQGRRSVFVDGKLTKSAPEPNDGSKIASLFRPRTSKISVGLGIFNSTKDLKLGIYTKDGVFGIKNKDGEFPSLVKVTSDEIRLELTFAPSTGLYKAYAYQGNGRQLISTSTESEIVSANLNYNSWKVGADCDGSIVDQFLFYKIKNDSLDFEHIISGSSVTYPVVDSSDEIMVKNLGSSLNSYQNSTDSIFISGFYAKS